MTSITRMNWLSRLVARLRPAPKVHHVWKEEREENLGSFLHFGSNVHEIETIYRIAVHERCMITGETRIRERRDLLPVRERGIA